MAEKAPQSYANHRRIVPGFHVGVFGIFVIAFVYRIVQLVRFPGWGTAIELAVALALLALFLYTRIFVLTVQDRVIRLEMRLRLKEVLPGDLKGRIGELSKDQLIGLRFASDAELADLTREVLANKITNRDDIKRRIKTWEADDLRC